MVACCNITLHGGQPASDESVMERRRKGAGAMAIKRQLTKEVGRRGCNGAGNRKTSEASAGKTESVKSPVEGFFGALIARLLWSCGDEVVGLHGGRMLQMVSGTRPEMKGPGGTRGRVLFAA
jgi:hypothetical protein